MIIEILILAAGASSRMRGPDKLLEPVGDRPLIAHMAEVALATGQPVSVTFPSDRPARRAALIGLAVTQITVADPTLGMTASLQAGLAVLPASSSVMVLLADMPDLTTDDLNLMLDLHRDHPDLILRACDTGGSPGHPVLFPPWVRPEIMALHGDPGPRQVLKRHESRLRMIPLAGARATTDLDTPEDWAAWRALNG